MVRDTRMAGGTHVVRDTRMAGDTHVVRDTRMAGDTGGPLEAKERYILIYLAHTLEHTNI